MATPRKMRGFDKLQLGAGPNPLPGWGNLDLIGKNLRWDLTRPLPLESGSIRFVYTEHFIEHVTRGQALSIFLECRRVLVRGGTIRISTPDMKVLASDYLAGKEVAMAHGDWYPPTPCRMINDGMRRWGHQFVYDEPELRSLLAEAGFPDVARKQRMESDHPELRNLETRPDYDDLILEASTPS